MKRASILLILSAFAGAGAAMAQDSDAAKAEAEALTNALRSSVVSAVQTESAATEVPGYGRTDLSHADLLGDPGALTIAGASAASINAAYQTALSPRPTVDATTIDLSGAHAVADDPRNYLGGTKPDGAAADCSALPSNFGAATYEASCNSGQRIESGRRECTSERQITFNTAYDWGYSCISANIPQNGFYTCNTFNYFAQGTCTQTGTSSIFGCADGSAFCYETIEIPVLEYSCSSELQLFGGTQIPASSIASENENGGNCSGLSGSCSQTSRVCSDYSATTRIINGVSITRDCWAWDEVYQCEGAVADNDCSQYSDNPSCSYSRTECLSYDDFGNCTVDDIWYSCQLPAEDTGETRYVCGDDLYCIDGDCTQVEREASDEFGDALVAIQALGEVQDGFDPDNMRLFPGEELGCTKALFGAVNCCSGKGVPLLTPFLCSPEDRLVDQRDDAGLCHYVGSYCKSKALSVCVAKKQNYCCYESKLTRIIQVQGRAQLNKSWGDPETPDCAGFTVQEFQQLDLAQMSFSEVYAEFADAAKLPDEIEVSVQIQDRIDAYYRNVTGGSGK